MAAEVPSREADKDGWTGPADLLLSDLARTSGGTSAAGTMRHGDGWTVWIYDMAQPTGEKRRAQVALIFGRLLPKGYQRETFAGRKAHPLDAARIQELGAFVERGQKAAGRARRVDRPGPGRQGGVRGRLRRARAGEARRRSTPTRCS